MSIFKPLVIIQNYQDFDYKLYKSQGFNTLFLDIDNTIVPYYQKEADEKALSFINTLKNNGFNIIVFSNNHKNRVQTFSKSINCKCYWDGYKPLPFVYNKIIKENDLDKNKIICLGDQLLTDTLGANLSGLKCVYVKPIVNKDLLSTVINRKIERLIFKYILHEKV